MTPDEMRQRFPGMQDVEVLVRMPGEFRGNRAVLMNRLVSGERLEDLPRQEEPVVRKLRRVLTPRPPKAPITTYRLLYFVRAYTRVKIGVTNDMKGRLKHLGNACPWPIEILLVVEIPNAYDIEQGLHKELAQYHAHREWFELPEDILADVLNRFSADVKDCQLPSVAS